MRQVFLRAVWLLRRPQVTLSFSALCAGGTALCFVPLFGVPGYELSEALAIGVGVAGGVFGIAAASFERLLLTATAPPWGLRRYEGAAAQAGAALVTALLLCLGALALPFLASIARALWSTRCDPFALMGFFPLLPLPSALFASAVGVLCGFWLRRGWAAFGVYLLVLLLTGISTGWPIYFGPQVYAFNHFLGYFPGPLYDEALTLRPQVFWFRAQTALYAGAVWLGCALCLDAGTGRLRRPKVRPAQAVLFGLLVAAALLIHQQGPKLGLRMTAGYLEGQLGAVRETPHFRLVYYRGKPKEEVDRLERDLEFRHHQLRSFLGDAPEAPITVYLYRDADQKQALVGAGGTQFAKPWRLELHVNDLSFPHPVLKHELLHVMAAPFGSGPFHTAARYGVFAQMAVVEGLAVAGDNRVDDLTLHQWAAAMRAEGLAPEIPALFSPGGFYRAAASRAYTLAGSFLRFLGEAYGPEKLRKLYLHGDFGAAYDQPLSELARAYDAFLDTVPLDEHAKSQAARRFRRPSLFARSCAREVATLEDEARQFLYSDPEQALALYQRIRRLQPEEHAFALGAALALDRLGREKDAAEVLGRLKDDLAGAPSARAEVAMSLGDLAWRARQLEVARRHYEEVLSLKPGPAMDRTARVKLAALGHPVLEPAIHAYFEEGKPDVKLFLLGEALKRRREDPWLHYLVGRRLTQADAAALALPHLDRALAGDLPASLGRESLRLKVEALYLAGDCAGVAKTVAALPDLGAAFTLWSGEWRDRCAFERSAYNGALVPQRPFGYTPPPLEEEEPPE